jgi:restriction endonuclease Mrr
VANTQYTKLGFNRLFKGCGSHQVPCSLIVYRSVTPTLHIATVSGHNKKRDMSRADRIFEIIQNDPERKMRVGDIHTKLAELEEIDISEYFNSSIVSSAVRQDTNTRTKNGQPIRFDSSEHGVIRIIEYKPSISMKSKPVEISEIDLPIIISQNNDKLRKEIKSAISNLTWQEFESSFLTQILEGLGFAKVEVSQPTRDEGIDAVCTYERGILKSEAIVSAKKWGSQRVGVQEVRNVRGVVRPSADTGIIVTSSRFTDDAKDEASKTGGNRSIILIDGELIVDTCIKEKIGVKVVDLPNLYQFEGFK